MKLRKLFLAALLVSGSVGLGVGTAQSHDMFSQHRMESQPGRNLTKIEDDQSLAPGVPGVTAENMMAEPDVLVVEKTIIVYMQEPESVEGFIIDSETGEILAFATIESS